MEDNNYIVFLLGADNFGEITKELRFFGKEFGMDTEYEKCKYIANKFYIYDKNNKNISEYDSLCKFIIKYEQQILDYIIKEKDFEIE